MVPVAAEPAPIERHYTAGEVRGSHPMMPEGFLLTPSQVAQRLQVSVAWIRDHSTRKHPRLPVVRIGGLLRYDPADIDQWIAEQREQGFRRAC
jgi:predicted DNA-binding transcriptional regulator AlpA